MKKINLIKGILGILIGFSLLAFLANAIAHHYIFKRIDYKAYDTEKYVTYEDVDKAHYPREQIKIKSGGNTLTAYLYGRENKQGLMIISPGHEDPNDIKLYEILYFVNQGWQVLCYDYTGCYTSEGMSQEGYAQSVHDLDAILDEVEADQRFRNLPIVLFGHSLGAYASAAVLQYGHRVKAAVVTSGFDTPEEQWSYSVQRYTGIFYKLLKPYTKDYIHWKYGKDANLSAIQGINSVTIPVLVVSGTKDIFYGGESPIYKKREQIINPNCQFQLMTEVGHNGHYDYYLTDEALAYEQQVDKGLITGEVDKWLYMAHNQDFMESLNDFLGTAIQ